MGTLTPTRLGMVETELRSYYPDGDGGAEAVTEWQPRGVRLDNDGCYSYWITMGGSWRLTHDGTGWRAEYRNEAGQTDPWSEGHIRRLADAAGPKNSFVSSLPMEDGGRYELIPGTVYELAFGIHEAGNKSALWLSESS